MLSVVLSLVEIRLSLLCLLALFDPTRCSAHCTAQQNSLGHTAQRSRYNGRRSTSAALLMFTHLILEFAVILIICIGTFIHSQRSVAYISHQ